jgi:hypothetical protein
VGGCFVSPFRRGGEKGKIGGDAFYDELVNDGFLLETDGGTFLCRLRRDFWLGCLLPLRQAGQPTRGDITFLAK